MQKFLFITSIVFVLLLSLLIGQRISFDNTGWLEKDHIVEQNKRYVEEVFTEENQLIIVISLASSFINYIEEINKLSKDIKNIDLINQIRTPLSAQYIINKKDRIIVSSLFDAYKKKRFAIIAARITNKEIYLL